MLNNERQNFSCRDLSFELWDCVDVSLEGSVDDVGTHIDHVWHDWLIHRTIPRNVSWLSVSVSISGSVVLMVDWGLSSSPLSVSVGKRWVSGKHLGKIPVEQVWVIHKRLGLECVIIHDNGSSPSQTSTETSSNEIDDPSISQPASNVEVLNGQLSDEEESKKTSNLGSSCVVGPVKV